MWLPATRQTKGTPVAGLAMLIWMLATGAAQAAEWSQVNRNRFNQDAVPVQNENPAWFKQSFLDLRSDLAEAWQAGKLGIVLFVSAERCSYCKAFINFTFGEPDIRRDLTRHFDVIGIDVIGDHEITDPVGKTWTTKQFVVEEKAYVTPALIFIRHDGRRMLRIVGYYPPDKFRGVLEYVLKDHYEREPLGPFLARRETGKQTGGSIHRDAELFAAPPYHLERRTKQATRPLLVLFERPNCASCDEFHRTVLTDPAIRTLIRKYDAIQLDSGDDHTSLVTPDGLKLTPAEWARKLDVHYAPALVFFNDYGQEVYRLDAELRRERTDGSLRLVLEKGYLDEPQLQRWRNLKGGHRAR